MPATGEAVGQLLWSAAWMLAVGGAGGGGDGEGGRGAAAGAWGGASAGAGAGVGGGGGGDRLHSGGLRGVWEEVLAAAVVRLEGYHHGGDDGEGPDRGGSRVLRLEAEQVLIDSAESAHAQASTSDP